MTMLLLERFVNGGAWIEIILLSFYASLLINKMKNPSLSSKWRKYSWAIFSILFFTQLIIGLFGFDRFLMTGELHFPIPSMIVAGPIYRLELSFMPILFLSTIVLSGPAWCSHFCYFGALDNLSASIKKFDNKKVNNALKFSILIIVVFTAIALRTFNVPINYTVIIASTFGIIGFLIITLLSSRKGSMVHCTNYCIIGTVIMYLKYISPFRMYIDSSCTECGNCTKFCKYSSLLVKNIKEKKPGKTCTLCGDCINTCSSNSIRYKLFNFSHNTSRNIYLIVTISIHVIFLGVARI